MTTDVHNLGNFASLAAAWERYPNGAMVGDYIFIAGVRYDWDKYEKQWLTPVAVTDMNISVFDVSTYDFEANDWRHALLNGEYIVVSNTQAVGKLLKYDDGFVLEGFVTLTEAGADKVFSPVVDGGKPKADAKILSGNQSYHKYVYVDSKGVYNVSDATERGQIDDIQHLLDDLQQYVDDNLNSLNKAVSAIKKNVGTAEDVAAADGTLYARISKNADDVDELRDAVGHIDSAQTATDKTVTQHTADISALQTAVKTKANLVDGKVSSEELPIVASLKQDDYTTIPSAKLVDEALTAVGNTLEEKINNKIVGLLNWRGVKNTTDEIKAITSAKKGDVWHSNGDGSEWVCTKENLTAADATAWTELGTPIDLGGYYTKNEVDKKVKPLADSIGSDSDAASANGSLYARIKKNATDISTNTANINATKEKVSGLDTRVTANTEAIATKASNSDLAALQSKVELKANQSYINGALIQKLTTASTEAEIRKAFTEVNTKTVLFPTPGSIISKLDGNNKGIVVSLSEPDATTLGRTITVDHGNDTYTIIVKSDFTKVLMPWTKISSKRNVYSSDIIYATSDLQEADIKGLFTPRAYKKYNIVFPVKPQTGDLLEEAYEDESRFTTIIALRNEENPNEYTDIFIPQTGRDNRYIKIVLKNDLTSIQFSDTVLFENYRRYYEGEQLLALNTVKAETIENSISNAYTIFIKDYGPTTTAQLPKVGDLIRMADETEEGYVPVCEVLVDSDDVQHTRWFYKGKLYEVTVNTALTRVPEDPKVIYDTTSGTLRDLYISAGAVYNEETGFYELNGLTDITEEEMKVIYKYAGTPQVRGAFAYSKARTNLPMPGIYNGWLCSSMFYNCQNLEVAYLGNRQLSPTSYDEPFAYSEGDNSFYLCQKLKKIYGRIYQKNTWSLMFGECLALEEVRIAELYSSIQLSWSPNLSKESVQYMITNAKPQSGAAVGSIAITLHPTAYARLKDDADIVAALEAKGGIVTLVSA